MAAIKPDFILGKDWERTVASHSTHDIEPRVEVRWQEELLLSLTTQTTEGSANTTLYKTNMGVTFSSIFSTLAFWNKNEEVRILMLGLDSAGKTTILYRLQIGEVVSTIPTIGFNVETVTYKNIKFQVWDLGGQTSIR